MWDMTDRGVEGKTSFPYIVLHFGVRAVDVSHSLQRILFMQLDMCHYKAGIGSFRAMRFIGTTSKHPYKGTVIFYMSNVSWIGRQQGICCNRSVHWKFLQKFDLLEVNGTCKFVTQKEMSQARGRKQTIQYCTPKKYSISGNGQEI